MKKASRKTRRDRLIVALQVTAFVVVLGAAVVAMWLWFDPPTSHGRPSRYAP